jgi:uncharacterized protein (TIGR02598 family)
MTRNGHAFSLIEVVIAVGVMSFAIVAILGLMPVGLKSVGEAGDATRTSMVAADAEASIRASVLPSDFTSATSRTITPIYYSREGIRLTSSSGGFYRVDATIAATWATSLPNVDQTFLRPVTAVLRWPIDTSNGNPVTNNSSSSFTFYVTKP